MIFSIYGRFRIEVRRENNAWTAYRSEQGKRTMLADLVMPSDLLPAEMATWLDDIFHEYASVGQRVELVSE